MGQNAGAAVSDSHTEPALSPYDTPASSLLRFSIEVIAWVAGPWAAAELTGTGWAVLPALVVLIGLPALFNTPGDKKTDGIATPGAIRVMIEMLLLVVAVAGAFIVWPWWAGAMVAVIAVAMIVTGVPRYRWLVTQPNPWAGDSANAGTESG